MRRYLPFLLLVAVGCRPAPGSYLQAAAVPKLEPGWRTHFKPSSGYSIALPGEFQSVDLSELEQKGSHPAASIAGSGPFGGILRTSTPDKPGTAVLSAMATDGNMLGLAMVVREDKKENVDRAAQTKEIVEAIGKSPLMEVVEQKEIDLPVGKASRIVAEMHAGQLKARVTSYVLVDGPAAYTALFFGMSMDGSKLPTKKIMQTFRVTKRTQPK